MLKAAVNIAAETDSAELNTWTPVGRNHARPRSTPASRLRLRLTETQLHLDAQRKALWEMCTSALEPSQDRTVKSGFQTMGCTLLVVTNGIYKMK